MAELDCMECRKCGEHFCDSARCPKCGSQNVQYLFTEVVDDNGQFVSRHDEHGQLLDVVDGDGAHNGVW